MNHPLHSTWTKMVVRCHVPATPQFEDYGGRGISVCARWRESFENFVADMGKRPPGLTLDRIDNDGDYEPGNCRWATRKQQNRNKRNNVRAEMYGETKLVVEWCEEFGTKFGTVNARLNKGWGIQAALYMPSMNKPGYAPKLTSNDVITIRAMNCTQIEIAEKFGIHVVTVSQIKRRILYPHLESDLEAQRIGSLYAVAS